MRLRTKDVKKTKERNFNKLVDFRVKKCRDNLNSLDSCLSEILEDIKPLLSNGDINSALIGQIVVKDRGQGQQTLGVDNTRINFRLEKARVTVNHFINNNDQLILNEIKPALSRDIALLIEGVLDSALSTLPADLLSLPEDLV
ncbi:hypothetical protein Avbf_11343 [Armadillidium vulgare]|nr:hypothetical protein Avbf_11343 [Armadillidium vulgare]